MYNNPETSFWINFKASRAPAAAAAAADDVANRPQPDDLDKSAEAHTIPSDSIKHATHEPHHKTSYWESFKKESALLINSVRPFVDKLADAAAWIGTGATVLAFKLAPVVTFHQVALWTVAIWGINRLIRSNGTSSAGHDSHH